MHGEAQRALEKAVADWRQTAQKLQAIAPDTDNDVRNELLKVQEQSEASIRYYSAILARRPRTSVQPVAQRVALAAFGASGVGLALHFATPAEPRR